MVGWHFEVAIDRAFEVIFKALARQLDQAFFQVHDTETRVVIDVRWLM